MMTEIKYDPELPFVVEWQPGSVWARFHQASDALEYVEREGGTFVDTTPKPKIPEDAEYLIWEFEGETNMAYRDDKDWYASGEWWSTEDLVDALKDAEVTVLVRKDET